MTSEFRYSLEWHPNLRSTREFRGSAMAGCLRSSEPEVHAVAGEAEGRWEPDASRNQ